MHLKKSIFYLLVFQLLITPTMLFAKTILYGPQLDTINKSIKGTRINAKNVGAVSQRVLSSDRGLPNPKNLKVFYKDCDPALYQFHRQGICTVVYKQYYHNIPVWQSLVSMTFVNGRVALVQERYFPDIGVSIVPDISKKQAFNLARDVIPTNGRLDFSELVIFPQKIIDKINYHLAWRIPMPPEQGHATMLFIDAHSGAELGRFDRTHSLVTGSIYPEHVMQKKITVPFSDNTLTVNGNAVTTDDQGLLAALEGDIFSGQLQGPYAKVVQQFFGNKALYEGTSPDWNWADYDTSYKQQESNVFYHVNTVHDFFTQGSPFDIAAMDYAMEVRLNDISLIPSCNAFASYEQTVDGKYTFLAFTPVSEQCEDYSLFSEIIHHEYTHSVVWHLYTYGLPYNEDTNEALADYFAMSISGNSCLGEFSEFDEKFTCVRNLKNTKRYPQDFYSPFSHHRGLIFSGALWDLREMLGKDLVDQLVILAMKSQAENYGDFLQAMILLDDDNGSVADGTPHIVDICHAFYDNHGVFVPACQGYTDKPVAYITEPAFWDYFLGGSIIGSALGSKASPLKSYSLEIALSYDFGIETPDWTLLGTGVAAKLEEVVGDINSQSIESGYYQVRLSVTDYAGGSAIFESPFYLETDLHEGWPKEAERPFDGVPAIADMDGNGQHELIVGSKYNGIYLWDAAGEYVAGWPVTAKQADDPPWLGSMLHTVAPPALADLDNDNILEIILTSGGLHIYASDGLAYGDWPSNYKVFMRSASTVGDFDQDGQVEFMATLAGDAEGKIVMWKGPYSFKPGWPIQFSATDALLISSVAVGDLDHDGDYELVVHVAGDGSQIHAFHHDGTPVQGWPQSMGADKLPDKAVKLLEGNLFTSPLLVDADNDGFPEVFAISGSLKRKIYGWNYQGELLPGWPQEIAETTTYPSASPIAVDMDQDGKVEIYTTGHKLYGWELDGTPLQLNLPSGVPIGAYIGQTTSDPVVGDLDGDGLLEILFTEGITNGELVSRIHAYHQDGSSVPGFPKALPVLNRAQSPVIGDADGDGLLELVVATNGGIYMYDMLGEATPQNMPWPKLRYDLLNSGNPNLGASILPPPPIPEPLCKPGECPSGWCVTDDECGGGYGTQCDLAHVCEPGLACNILSWGQGSCVRLSGQTCENDTDCFSNFCASWDHTCQGALGDQCGPSDGKFCDPHLQCDAVVGSGSCIKK